MTGIKNQLSDLFGSRRKAARVMVMASLAGYWCSWQAGLRPLPEVQEAADAAAYARVSQVLGQTQARELGPLEAHERARQVCACLHTLHAPCHTVDLGVACAVGRALAQHHQASAVAAESVKQSKHA